MYILDGAIYDGLALVVSVEGAVTNEKCQLC